MDNKKIVADFINSMCKWVTKSFNDDKKANGYRYVVKDDNLAYLLADKGIEKRIKKQLFKRYSLKSFVRYELNLTDKNYPNGDLIIELTEGMLW